MNRIELIQKIFQKTNFKNYLEIGCRTGTSFLPIKAKHKTAIDPIFKIPFIQKVKWTLKYPINLNNRYFEVESDIFFTNEKKYIENLGQFDVVLIDGLHTFQQSLNDAVNSLKYLNKDGIIIMHDCLPPHKLAALPLTEGTSIEEMKKIKGWTGEWNGDVWKTIVYLRRTLGDLLDICVIDADYGLGIIIPKVNVDTLDYKIDRKEFLEIDKLTYEDLNQNVDLMLNLKKPDYSFTIINEIASRNGM